MKQKWLFYLQLHFILLILWVILFENHNSSTLVSGILINFFVIAVSEKFFMKNSFYNDYNFNIFHLAKYFLVLLFEIYIAGFAILVKIITGQINPDIVDITTDLKEPYKKCILANSITLTPGTVTLDLYQNSLKVLWLDTQTKNPAIAGKMIKQNLERHLH